MAATSSNHVFSSLERFVDYDPIFMAFGHITDRLETLHGVCVDVGGPASSWNHLDIGPHGPIPSLGGRAKAGGLKCLLAETIQGGKTGGS